MIHRIILSAFSLLTLATCQNKSVPLESTTTENTEVKHKTTVLPTKSTPMKPTKTGEPEMSVGLPPDKEAQRIAEVERKAAVVRKQAGVTYLKEGENRYLKEYEMNVTFKQMSEDSRCPKDVNCIWAGVATADVEFMGLATRPVMLKLSTMSDAKKGYSKVQEFNGYTVSLVQVSPETTSAKGYKALKGSYTIGLKFEKGTANTPTTQRTGTTTK